MSAPFYVILPLSFSFSLSLSLSLSRSLSLSLSLSLPLRARTFVRSLARIRVYTSWLRRVHVRMCVGVVRIRSADLGSRS